MNEETEYTHSELKKAAREIADEKGAEVSGHELNAFANTAHEALSHQPDKGRGL